MHTHPFRGPTAFLSGEEGHGMCEAHKAHCDHFIYIPQYAVGGGGEARAGGTASLNVAVSTSIVLHHYALWAGFAEAPREGEKFVVAERAHKTGPAPPTNGTLCSMHGARRR